MEKFSVSGMSCAACSARIEKVVGQLPGVEEVAVSLLTNSMTVDFAAPASAQSICQAVEKAGYGAAPATTAQAPAAPAEGEETGEWKKVRTRLIASVCLLLPLMYEIGRAHV